MPIRNAALKQAVELYRRISDDQAHALDYTRQMMINLLSPDLTHVFNYASVRPTIVTGDVQKLLHCSESQASTLLKELWEVGLLARVEAFNDKARWYEYFSKTVNSPD